MTKKVLVLVTGAGGFIGSNLTEELVKRGYKVRVLIKRGESKRNISELIQRKDIEIIEGDLLDKISLKKACVDVEIVFHLAAKTDLATKNYRPYYLTNVVGTKNLVESCGKNLKRFVFYSSILAEGLPNTRKNFDETYKGYPQHGYGKSKRKQKTTF